MRAIEKILYRGWFILDKSENMSLYVNKLKEVLEKNSDEYKKIRVKINEAYNFKKKKE